MCFGHHTPASSTINPLTEITLSRIFTLTIPRYFHSPVTSMSPVPLTRAFFTRVHAPRNHPDARGQFELEQALVEGESGAIEAKIQKRIDDLKSKQLQICESSDKQKHRVCFLNLW